jgi:hypothetical protein
VVRLVRRTLDRDLIVLERDLHLAVQRASKLTLWTFHVHGVAVDLDGDALRDDDRVLSNS